MKRVYIFMFFLMIYHVFMYGQNLLSADKWKEYIEEMAEDTDDEARIEALYAELSDMAEHPVDLNAATREDLARLPFLSDEQINNIISHISLNGEMVSIYELKDVSGMDFATLELLFPFVCVPEQNRERYPISGGNILRNGKHEVLMRYDQCLQQKKGYRNLPDSMANSNRKYLGEPFYNSLRYSFTYHDRIQAGFSAEKDAGEPFMNRYHRGYDFYSAHLLVHHLGCIKSIAVGDYRASFGQGLAFSSEFMLSKVAAVTEVERRSYGIRRHSSTNESDFLRGAAVAASLGKVDIHAFYSFRKLDANMNDSSAVTSIKTDGLHNIARERAKAGALDMQTIGANARYSATNFATGLTAVHYSFLNHEIMPDEKPYNCFYFRGRENTNISVDYALQHNTLKFYGETAISSNNALATLNAIKFTPAPAITLLMLYRYYDKRYQAFFSSAFSQGTRVQNEEGAYAGLKYSPSAAWNLSACADIYRFPWLNYGVDAPSSGFEYMLQADYVKLGNASFYIRYRHRQKEKNSSVTARPTANILPFDHHRLRLQSKYRLFSIDFKTTAEGVVYEENRHCSKGWAITQSIGWNPSRPLQINLFAALFSTADYNSRLSSFEKNIIHAYNSTQLYGKGHRLSTIVRWNIRRRLTLFVKLSNSHYTDRDLIGTGLEEIRGRDKTDARLLLRWII